MCLLLSVSPSNPPSFLLAPTEHQLHVRPCAECWGSTGKKSRPQDDVVIAPSRSSLSFWVVIQHNQMKNRNPLGSNDIFCSSEMPERNTHLLWYLAVPPWIQWEKVKVKYWKLVVLKYPYTSESPGGACWNRSLGLTLRFFIQKVRGGAKSLCF